MTVTFNYQNGEIVSSLTIIVSGRTSSGIDRGIVVFTNNNNKVFPPQCVEVNRGQFKALVHISPDEDNLFKAEVISNGMINHLGFAEYSGTPNIVDNGELRVTFKPLPQNNPVHLCVVIGRDSNGSYDMPLYKLKRGEESNLDTAIRTLKVAGRMMQALTHEDMRAHGFSNRCFQFVEETQSYQNIFGYNVKSPTPHQEIKIHVLRSPKSVAEIRDLNYAQQNSKASDSVWLFSHAIDLIRQNQEFKSKNLQTIQCAAMYLDSTYDIQNDMILAHAALGGGTNDVKLAIFGSHGLHSWPINFPRVVPSFLDATHLSKREVANDCNECGTSWECLNITMGAFMHEIGHLLGCPHQVDGIMLRSYVWWNRSFMTRELESLRTGSRGEIIDANGMWPQMCHWNILDLIRFLHHDSFALPIDQFDKVFTTKKQSDNNFPVPAIYKTPSKEVCIKSKSGIYLVEIITEDLARFHMPFYPKSYGGQGNISEITLDYETCYQNLRIQTNKAQENFDVRVLSLSGELFLNDMKKQCTNDVSKNIIKSDFGLNRGIITGYKSEVLGNSKDKKEIFVGFDIRYITNVRVYHGGALDGIRFYYSQGQVSAAPKVPPRNYLKSVFGKSPSVSQPRGETSVLLGNEKPHYTDFPLQQGEVISKFHFRNGGWIDAVQIELTSGRVSPWYGNATGGHLSTLEPPGKFSIIGMYGYVGSWMDGIGIIYSNDL